MKSVETTKNVESTQLVPDTKEHLKATTKPNPTTQPNTKDLCGPKRQTRNLKNEAIEGVISIATKQNKNASSSSVQKTKINKQKNM